MEARWPALAGAAALAVLFVAECVLAERADAPTYDETTHLSQGLLHLVRSDYRFQVDHPPLAKLVAGAAARLSGARLPADSPEWRADLANRFEHRRWAWRVLYRTPGNDPERLFRAGRLALVPLALVTLLVAGWWTRQIHGVVPGLVALALGAVDPNLIAHGHLVTSDAAVTALLAAAAYALWRALVRWRIAWALAAGACLGLALATKYTALVLVPLVPALALGRALDPAPWPAGRAPGRPLAGRPRRLAAAGALVLLVGGAAWAALWAPYRLQAAAAPGAGVGLTARAVASWMPGPRPLGVALVERAVARRLVPDAWGFGLVFLAADTRLTPRLAYLAGELSERGWWYYFPATLALKVPIATLLLAAVGVAATIGALRRAPTGSADVPAAPPRGGRAGAARPPAPAARPALAGVADRTARRWASIVVGGVPLALLLAAATSALDLGLRQVLPVYPFLLVLAGGGAAAWLRLGPRRGPALVLGAVLWAGASSAAVAPAYLAYFNELGGGPDGGRRWLADSNLDWGQALRGLPAWLRARGIAEVNLCYFGTADPAAYGLPHVPLPGCTAYERAPSFPRLPGHVAISASHLAGIYHPPDLRVWYRELLARGRLVGVVGRTILVYEVPGEP